MLVLSRKRNQQIVIGDNIVVTVVKIGENKVWIGIDAPKDIPVNRMEVRDPIDRAAKKESEDG